MTGKGDRRHFSTIDFEGVETVLYQSTMDARDAAGKHTDLSGNMTLTDVEKCLQHPHIVTTSQHEDKSTRYQFYRSGDTNDGAPPYRKVIVERGRTPAAIVTWFRTGKIGNYSDILFMKDSSHG